MTEEHTYAAIARAISDTGVRDMFGLMGDANLFFIDHYVRECGGKFVPVAYEGSAVLMALAYAHVAGTVGVATVTHGPALTNCVTALTEGARGNIPMVLLAGDTPVGMPQHLQSIDQREVVKVCGAGFVQMRSPDTASYDVAHAFYRARVEKRPVVLNMPADFMWEKANYSPQSFKAFSTPAYVPEGEELEEAIGMIAAAKRPIVLAGAGAIDAREQLIRLADRLQAPLATTLKAKDLFSQHPHNLGIFGTLSTDSAYEVFAKSDCVVAFGTSLHYFTTDRGELMKDKRVVQVNESATEVCKNYHPNAALIADAALTADNFVHWLDEAEIPSSQFTDELEPHAIARHPKGNKRPPDSADGYINFEYALDRLNRALPSDRLLSTDGGRFMTEVWCRIDAPDPRSFIATTNFGSIGLGLQVAIGAGIAEPERPVVMFTGDGGFMMGGINEFNTAVRLGLDLVVVLCNDAAYGAEHIQFLDKQMDPGLTQFEWPSFAEVATACGGAGYHVQTAAQLEDAIGALEGRKGPVLIELMIDPNEVPRMRI